MGESDWQPPHWVFSPKHRPPRGHTAWDGIVSQTAMGRKVAKYRKGLFPDEIEALEMSFEVEGHFIREKKTVRFYYIVRDEVVGASLGEETSIVRVQRHRDGSVHGYPITEEELIEELRKHNPEEFERYRERTEP